MSSSPSFKAVSRSYSRREARVSSGRAEPNAVEGICVRDDVLRILLNGGSLSLAPEVGANGDEAVVDRSTGEVLAVSLSKPRRDVAELGYFCLGFVWELAEVLPRRVVDYAPARWRPSSYSPYEADEYAWIVGDFIMFYERHGKLPTGFDPLHFAEAYLYRAKGLANDDPLITLLTALYKPKALCSEDGDVALALTPLVVHLGGSVVDDCRSADLAVVRPEAAPELADGKRVVAVLGRTGMLGKERTSLYKLARARGYFVLGSPLGRGLLVLIPRFLLMGESPAL